jgi:hypothetical protein
MKTLKKSKLLLLTIFILSASTLAQAQKKKTTTTTKTSTTKATTTKSTKTTAVTSSTKSTKKTRSKGFDYHNIEAAANLHFYAYPIGDGNRDVNAGISATGGYKITPEILVGLKLGSQFEKSVSSFEVGVLGRYYFNHFFAGLGITHGTSSYSGRRGIYYDDPYYNNYYYYDRGTYDYGTIEGGYRFDINKHIAIETALDVNLPFAPSGQDVWFGLRAGAVYKF